MDAECAQQTAAHRRRLQEKRDARQVLPEQSRPLHCVSLTRTPGDTLPWGVVIEPGTLRLDRNATKRLRAERCGAARLPEPA